jgi:hypothetical protein
MQRLHRSLTCRDKPEPAIESIRAAAGTVTDIIRFPAESGTTAALRGGIAKSITVPVEGFLTRMPLSAL